MKKLQKQNLTDHRPNEATDQDYVIVPIQGPIVLKTVKKQDFTGKQILSFEIVDQYKKEGTTVSTSSVLSNRACLSHLKVPSAHLRSKVNSIFSDEFPRHRWLEEQVEQ